MTDTKRSDDRAVNMNAVVESLDTEQIKEMIPHRYPMLMIDRVENIVRGKSAVGIKCITNNEPIFQGHFPNQAIFPGVLIIEAMAQTAAVSVIDSLQKKSAGDIVYFMSIENARFRKPVTPGVRLELHVRNLQNRRNVWKYEGIAKVGETVYAEATFMAMIVDAKDA